MKNGDLSEFLDKLYLGEELLFEYQGLNFFLQGWSDQSKATMVLDCQATVPFENYIWKCVKTTMRECAEEFLQAPIWSGKSFLQIQRDVFWQD